MNGVINVIGIILREFLYEAVCYKHLSYPHTSIPIIISWVRWYKYIATVIWPLNLEKSKGDHNKIVRFPFFLNSNPWKTSSTRLDNSNTLQPWQWDNPLGGHTTISFCIGFFFIRFWNLKIFLSIRFFWKIPKCIRFFLSGNSKMYQVLAIRFFF